MAIINVDRLRDALAGSTATQSDLARYVGVTPAAIQQLISGKTRRSVHLSQIAKFLNVSEDWLLDKSDDHQRYEGVVNDYIKFMSLIDLDTATSSTLGNFKTIAYDLSIIPFWEDRPVLDSISQDARWIMVTNIGDDMAPAMRHEDKVVVDLQAAVIDRHDAIWLVRIGSDLPIFRKVERLGGNRSRLFSENTRVDDQELAMADVTIFGRVVWQSRVW